MWVFQGNTAKMWRHCLQHQDTIETVFTLINLNMFSEDKIQKAVAVQVHEKAGKWENVAITNRIYCKNGTKIQTLLKESFKTSLVVLFHHLYTQSWIQAVNNIAAIICLSMWDSQLETANGCVCKHTEQKPIGVNCWWRRGGWRMVFRSTMFIFSAFNLFILWKNARPYNVVLLQSAASARCSELSVRYLPSKSF